MSYLVNCHRSSPRPQEWNSGENIWLVDVVGMPESILKALRSLSENQLADVSAKLPIRNENGQLSIIHLDQFLSEKDSKL